MHRVNDLTGKEYILNLTTAEDMFYFVLMKRTAYKMMVIQDDGVVTLIYDSEGARDHDYKKMKDDDWRQLCYDHFKNLIKTIIF